MPSSIKRPQRAGRSAEGYALDLSAFASQTREAYAASAKARREDAIARERFNYIWLASTNTDCDVANRNAGRLFSFADAHEDGHPGEGACHASDWCRCLALSVIRLAE